MATRVNFDSSALSTGLSVADVFADLEIKFIANRKNLFNTALKTDNFRDECIRQFRAYNEANKAAVATALNEASELVGYEIGRTFNIGVTTVDKAVNGYKQQGFKPQKEPTDNRFITALKVNFALQVVNAFAGVASYAQQAADKHLRQIVFQVDEKAENIKEQIDNVQNVFLFKGIAGTMQANGVEKSMTAESEFIMRNESQQALLTAQGERRAEYGINYIRVSAHPSSCELCTPFQGQLLIDDRYGGGIGDGKTPLLSQAIAAGLFHWNCFDKETEVLTNRGWKLFKDLDKNDLVYSLNPETKEAVFDKPINYYKKLHNGKMVQFKSNILDLLVTPDHNMLYKTQKNKKLRFKKAADVTTADSFYGGQEWKGNNSEFILLGGKQVKSELYCKLMAYYLADGSKHNEYGIKIAQTNNEDMYNELKELPFEVWKDDNKIIIYSKEIVSEFAKYGTCTQKYVPKIIKTLSRELINIFLMAYAKTDGYISKNKAFGNYKANEHIQLFTTSNQMAADLGELILKAGYRPSYYLSKDKGKKILFKNGEYTINNNLWIININRCLNFTKLNKTFVDYNDYVYCVEVTYHTLLVRRNGKVVWCGNCRHEAITEIPGFENKAFYNYDKASVKETAERYAVEQQQRYNERQIRAYKARAAGLMDDNKKAIAEQKISEWQARQRALRDIAKSEGVPFYRQYDREQIGGKTQPNLPQYRIIYGY